MEIPLATKRKMGFAYEIVAKPTNDETKAATYVGDMQ